MVSKNLRVQISALFFFLIIWCFWFATPVAAEVVISEVLPDPAATSDKSEWIEILNDSSTDTDLSSYKLDNLSLSTILPANEYLVITKNITEFVTEFGSVKNLLELPISLTNSGDTITITRPDLATDTFTYASTYPSKSWERGGPLCTDKWKIHDTSNTVGAENDYKEPSCIHPVIDTISLAASLDENTWEKNIVSIGSKLIYLKCTDSALCLDGKWTMDTEEVGQSTELGVGTHNYAYIDKEGMEHIGGTITIYPRIEISEVMMDPEGSDSGKEWLEIHNMEEVEVDIAEVGIQLSGGGKYQIKDLSLLVDQYYVYTFPASVLPNCGGSTCPFSITLLYGDLVVDTMTYTESKSGRSLSSVENSFTFDYTPTPGKKNEEEIKTFDLVITEVYAAPDTSIGEIEWVEVYNYGEEDLLISDLELVSNEHVYALPIITLKSKKYLLLNDISFSLVNTGATLSLMYKDSEIASFTYPKSVDGVSVIRMWEEGEYLDEIVETYTPTPGWRNKLTEKAAISDTQTETRSSSIQSLTEDLGLVLSDQDKEDRIPTLTPKITYREDIEEGIPLSLLGLCSLYCLVFFMIVDLKYKVIGGPSNYLKVLVALLTKRLRDLRHPREKQSSLW